MNKEENQDKGHRWYDEQLKLQQETISKLQSDLRTARGDMEFYKNQADKTTKLYEDAISSKKSTEAENQELHTALLKLALKL